jgi:hypothetical protein
MYHNDTPCQEIYSKKLQIRRIIHARTMISLNYTPPGPVALAFHQDDSFFRGLKGPVGSGKSSSCCIEIFYRALKQAPSPDKVRRSRWCAIRNTYGELKSTTIKTWCDWFDGMQVMKWDTPIVSTIKLPDLGDGTSLELEVMFIALDRPDDAGKLRSLELTGAWLNEASELEKTVMDMATQRVGRYPSMRVGGPSWTGIIADTNPPDDDSWWYKLACEGTPDNFKFFDQPGGLYKVMDKLDPDYGKYRANPDAENVQNIKQGYDYYFNQLGGKTEDYIRVFLEGKYGTTMDGKPVFPEWADSVHIAATELEPIRGYPLVLGFDFGLTPACTIGQMSPKGQLLILDELVSEDMGIRQFYSEVVMPHLAQYYSGFRVEAVGDPAGVNRSQTDERTCFEELASMGLVCEPASTNEFVKRRESVAFFLQRMTSSGPGFQIDPRCKTLIKGFRGGYRYERLKVSGSARFKDRPIKDRFSHPHDSLQYLALHFRAGMNPVRARPVQDIAWA